jgi:Ca-activated chloride channel homolog
LKFFSILFMESCIAQSLIEKMLNILNPGPMLQKRFIHSVLLLIIAAAFIAFSSPSGEIKGVVKEKGTGEAIPFATIRLMQKGVFIAGAASDLDGRYSFKNVVPGDYDVEVTYIGYEKRMITNVKVAEGKVSYVDAIIAPSSVQLETLEIVTYQQPLIDADVKSCYKVTREEIKNMSVVTGGVPASYEDMTGGVLSIDHNTEEYDKINDNEFKKAKSDPLSTFSIDVDAASYSNMRRFINQGSLPPEDAVRVEEMINYFSYDYPQPKGDDPFSINMEMSECPWNKEHRLVHIGLQGKIIEAENLPPSNLVFLIDVSGSMDSPDKLPLLKSAFGLLIDQLRAEDRVSIVVYAGAAGLVLPSTPGSEKEKIREALSQLSAGGSTAGGQGILLAYKIAQENFLKKGNNRVILATDGDFNVGVSSDAELTRIVEEKREEGVFLTVLGFGTGNYKDSKMEKLADNGNGNYAYVDNLMEAKKVLVKEMGGTLHTIAKDVKIQVEFNPAHVKAYRLIGYENRALNNEDFNNDKKDAGELGSGHAVTALYEIIPADSKSKEEIAGTDPLKYQETALTDKAGTQELMTIKFRYKEPGGIASKLIVQTLANKMIPFGSASENFKFSAAVAGFGMVLRDSKFKGTSGYKTVLSLAKESKGEDEEGYRAEFIRLVEMCELLDTRTAKK